MTSYIPVSAVFKMCTVSFTEWLRFTVRSPFLTPKEIVAKVEQESQLNLLARQSTLVRNNNNNNKTYSAVIASPRFFRPFER